jgi:putative sigma-54 modulation protein
MEINIKATKAQLVPGARATIEEKIESLNKYCHCIIRADVELGITTFHHQKGDIYRAEVNLEVPGKVLRAEAETDDIVKSINLVRDKLKKELVRYKEIKKG